ncbi:MAG: hypothetical protein OEQ13_10220 [Acidobacteriota bacterium]|nr:hypothetical protein [Acidobacteriota bacterium]
MTVWPSPHPRARLVAVLAAAAFSISAAMAREEPRIVYDSEFQGYVPVVAGVERPDLVTAHGAGRAPDSIKQALKLARRGLRTEAREAARRSKSSRRRGDGGGPLHLSRRWLRRHAVSTELEVLGASSRPVENARVYRFIDPAFYPVNEDENGARLFGAYRFLPYPFPALAALRAVRLHEETWLDEQMLPVLAGHPDIDQTQNPWLAEFRAAPAVPIEFVGRTNLAGRLSTICGVFNLNDEKKFPRAIVPETIRIGYVVMADGYQPAFTEKSFEHGGVSDQRRVRLLESRDAEVFLSLSYQAAQRVVDAIDVSASRPFAEINLELRRIVEDLEDVVARLPEHSRDATRGEAGARLASRLYRKAAPVHLPALARLASALTPDDPARLSRLASERAAQQGGAPSASAEAADSENGTGVSQRVESMQDVESSLREVVARTPGFLPAYALLDATLVERGASETERRKPLRQLLRLHPFDRWGRARLAVSLLKSGKTVEAFDHLRYTWMMVPRLAGDDELGRTLADHYWRLGLTEKAGIFARLLTGKDPEDPSVRVRGGYR